MHADARGVCVLPRCKKGYLRTAGAEGILISAEMARLFGMHRLESSAYREVFNSRRPYHGRTMTMWVRISADAGRRVGVVVSKRNFRRAVDRNRVKRLMREAFRLQRVNLTEDADVILSAKRAMAGLHRQEVEQDFERLCRRAGIWRA